MNLKHRFLSLLWHMYYFTPPEADTVLNVRAQHHLKYFTDASAQASLFFVGGISLKILKFSLACPMFAIFGSMATTGLAIKILNRYNLKTLIQIKINILEFDNRYPKIRIIALIFTIAIGTVSSMIGCLAGVAFGVYAGLVASAEYSKVQNSLEKRKNELQRNQIILS